MNYTVRTALLRRSYVLFVLHSVLFMAALLLPVTHFFLLKVEAMHVAQQRTLHGATQDLKQQIVLAEVTPFFSETSDVSHIVTVSQTPTMVSSRSQ